MNLKELFPTGEYGTAQETFNVKQGPYFWPAAKLVDRVWVLTPFGKSLLPAEAQAVTEPEPSLANMSPSVLVSEPKRKGKKASAFKAVSDDLDLDDL